MVRISDLIKGRTPSPPPAPAPASDDRSETISLRNISGLSSVDAKKTPPKILPEKPPEQQAVPIVSPEPQAVQVAAPEQQAVPVAPPEQPVAPLLGSRFTSGSRDIYLAGRNHLLELQEKLRMGNSIDLQVPLTLINQIIAEPSLIDEMYQLTLELEHSSDMYITSPLNSMIYSYKIGMRMGYTPPMLTEICLAALHHDIGMFIIPHAILRKEGKLTDSEFAAMRKHTETGRDLFIALDYPNVGRAIYEHHERENGQGYPLGLKGEAISEYAKIIGLCDSYEAMTHNRPHKKAAAQYVSVLQLAGSKDHLFAPHIVKIFLDEITLYPIGSYVRLNNKAIGLVVQTNQGNPMKPTVRIVVDGHGKKATEEKLINLAQTNILTIVAGVSSDELPV